MAREWMRAVRTRKMPASRVWERDLPWDCRNLNSSSSFVGNRTDGGRFLASRADEYRQNADECASKPRGRTTLSTKNVG